jgi:hypothetical protein
LITNSYLTGAWTGSSRIITAWDIGIGEATAIWFVQQIGKEVHVIDYYERPGQGLDHYVKVIEENGYFDILPHDPKILVAKK